MSEQRSTGATGWTGAVDPDEHPGHVEEWRDDAANPTDVDREAVIDELSPHAVQTDRGESIIVPDEDRPVVVTSDDDLDDDLPEDDAVSGDEPDGSD